MGETSRQPSIGVVVLTMGNRPDELQRALSTLMSQDAVDLDVVVVGNGWDPIGLPSGVRGLFLEENIGIPAGRNAGVPNVSGEFLCFLDDDSWFLDAGFLADAVSRFRRHPQMGMLQPRITDPANETDPRRWIPRLNKRTAEESSRVFHVGETCLVMARATFEATGGWAGGFWYATRASSWPGGCGTPGTMSGTPVTCASATRWSTPGGTRSSTG